MSVTKTAGQAQHRPFLTHRKTESTHSLISHFPGLAKESQCAWGFLVKPVDTWGAGILKSDVHAEKRKPGGHTILPPQLVESLTICLLLSTVQILLVFGLYDPCFQCR